jgi:hypothetical protein
MTDDARDANLSRRLISGLFWIAALGFAVTWYFATTKLLRSLPPTDPVAIGRVTVDGVSKLRDYLGAAIFYLFVPVATVGFHRAGSKIFERLAGRMESDSVRVRLTAAVLFALPYAIAPFLYITTRSEGRAIVFPVILSTLGAWSVVLLDRKPHLMELMRGPQTAYHALVTAAGFSLLLFRYTTTQSRLASDRTLFLELPLVALAIATILGVAVLMSRWISNSHGELLDDVYPRIAWATSPLLALVPLGLTKIPAQASLLVVGGLTVVLLLIAAFVRTTISPTRTRFLVAWLVIPMLLFCFNYATTASSTYWTDLFHRGESLGPASDYLRGKVPYRDVFILHGLFENGFLDAGLMNILGREVQVSAMRMIVIDCLGLAAIGVLAMAIFNSIPLTLATVLVALVTSVNHQRAAFAILSIAFLVLALRAGRVLPLALSGTFAGLAFFYSMDMGLYSVAGVLLTLIAVSILGRIGSTEARIQPGPSLASFGAGLAVVSVPILLYLLMNGALEAFITNSFITIPSIIDAVWSLPYPGVEGAFTTDRSLRTLADFVLGEKIRFLLNPSVLVMSLVYLAFRIIRKKLTVPDQLLMALTFTSLLTQRSALGRADFPHQHFAAFLLSPIIVLLIIALWRALSEAVRPDGLAGSLFAGSVLAMIAATAFVALWVPDLIDARIEGARTFRSRMAGGGHPTAHLVHDRVDAVSREVRALLADDEPLFDFSNQPALYFFADRPNPTRFYQIPIISPVAFQQEVILALEASKPRIVLRGSPEGYDNFDGIPNDLRAPAVAAYLNDHYGYASSVRGVELWQRLESAPRFVLANYLARHRVPTPAEVADSRSRQLFFPSVASGPGAGGSYWRSDLLLYNASDREADVQVRYISTLNASRSITLAPRASLQSEDVVAFLLQRPETFGSLIVTIPEGAAVIARIMTYDASKNVHGQPEAPLTIEQSAGPERPMRALAIPGQPSDSPRRVHIDAANVGQGPAEIEITASGPDGSHAGRSIRTEIPEQTSFRLMDAETQLELPLDHTVMVRIEIIRGTVVASASFVNAETGETRAVPGVPVP